MREMKLPLLAITTLAFALPTAANPVTDFFGKFRGAPADQTIMWGWVPDVDQLELIPGDEIGDVYGGRTVKAIYSITFHDDQRFVETHTREGRVDYHAGNFSSPGDWYVRGDLMCFRYDAEPEVNHCFHKFRYGGCLVTYPANVPLVDGKPLSPTRWGSVQQYADDDFRWPERPASKRDAFVCKMMVS